MEYDDRHRAFLQVVMQIGTVPDHEVQQLCARIFEKKVNVSNIVALVNHKLTPINMLMKCGICELSGDKFWSVVSTIHDEKLLVPSEFSVAQRAFLREIYSEIITSANGFISSTDGLNLSRTLGVKLNMGDADSFLKNLYKNQWLYAKNGCIFMGIRSILELMPYFRATYENIFRNCLLCKEITFYGYKCENCSIDFHNYCLRHKIELQKENVCPQCKHRLEIDELEDNPNNSEAEPKINHEEQEDEPMEIPSDEDSDIEINITPKARPKKRTIRI